MPLNTPLLDRVLPHIAASRRLVVEPDDVYILDGDDTIVRRRGRHTLRDVRRLKEVVSVFERYRAAGLALALSPTLIEPE